ncbi:MAG: PDZ domain-containing protein [Pseudomonadota bacterium]|nr:PDZ domain-containing protein [Pseudomonadota bacterium]
MKEDKDTQTPTDADTDLDADGIELDEPDADEFDTDELDADDADDEDSTDRDIPQIIAWKPIAITISASFVCATLISSTAAIILTPKDTRIRKTAINNRPANLQSDPQLNDENVKVIMQRNIFNAEGDFGLETDTKREAVAEIIKSELPLKLKGTIASHDERNGIALFEFLNSRKQDSFFVGETIMQGVKLHGVYKERVVINNREQLEYIELEKKELANKRKISQRQTRRKYASIATSPAAKEFREEGFERRGAKIQMSSDYKAKLLGPEFTKVLQDAKASPNVVNGKLRGFVLTRIREDSIYRKSGLQNGDIVEEINGVLLTDTAQAIKLLNSLRNESEIELRVVRGGNPVNFEINVQ